MTKEKLREINKYLIVLLILVQPFINIIQACIVRDVQVFGFSLFEMINVILIGFSTILTIYLYDDKKKFIKYIPYIILLGIYFILHYYNTTLFNLDAYSKQKPSLIIETYYLGKLFILPLMLIFNVYYSGIKQKTCVRILQTFLFIVCFVMIITNLLKVAHVNYSETVTNNLYSFFDWFSFKNTDAYSYYKLTTKGWFLSGNQMSAILFMTLPITLYLAYKKRSPFDYLLLVMQSLSMFMLGTKTANLGVMLIFLTFIIIWLFFYLLKYKLTSLKPILVIGLVFYFLFPFSPIGYMSKKVTVPKSGSMLGNLKDSFTDPMEYEKVSKVVDEIDKMNCSSLNNKENKVIKNFMKDYSGYFGIDDYIVTNYNDLNHSGFWCQYLKSHANNDYRVLKKSVLKDIYKNNHNQLDRYLGLGNTLNFIYTESDYSYQYYLYGIIGVILFIGPYFVLLGYLAYKVLKNFKSYFIIKTAVYAMAPVLGLFIGYYSGHVLERNFPLLILGFVMAINLLHIKETEEELDDKVMFISSTGGHLSELLQLQPMFSKYDYQLITEKTDSTIGLKNTYQNRVHYLIFGTKDHLFSYLFKFSANIIKSFYYFIIYQPDYIVTTGTHTAVPMCYIGKFFGSRIVFIETFANRTTRTLAGRLVYPIADNFIVQWEDMCKLYPDAIFGGWIY